LAGVVGNSRICDKQQGTYSDKDFAIYGKLWKEMRMGGDIRKKGKVESATEFVERMKKVHKEAEAALRKTQEEMRR